MPELIVPMFARATQLPVPDQNFAYEIKWDGIRAIAFIQRGKLRLQSRNLLDMTMRYPELNPLATSIAAHSAILDGEIVALAEDGIPRFELLQARMGLGSAEAVRMTMRTTPAIYMIFDLLYLNGRSLVDENYLQRRETLQSLKLADTAWQTPPYNIGDGHALLELSRKRGLEGIIAKRIDSVYEPGMRTGAWRKIKNQLEQEFVIGGISPGEGSRSGGIGSLLLGYYDKSPSQAAAEKVPQRLLYAGKVGTGFTDAMLDRLSVMLAPFRQLESPFAERHPDFRRSTFVAPRFIAECVFSEWTRDGRLRHPSFKGLRDDKPAIEIVREAVNPEPGR